MSEKCTTVNCHWYDGQAEENCGGELHGEPAIASCDRKPKGDPADRIAALARENAELKSAVSRLVAALRNLHDEQNGPPKCWDTAGWDAAMEETEELLKEFEK
jgi:hypothetical protein